MSVVNPQDLDITSRVVLRFGGINLKKLKNLSGVELEEYVDRSFPLLNQSGRTRRVYSVGSKKVLKLAKNSDGIIGNKSELTHSKERFAVKVFDSHPKFEWIISERVLSISEGMLEGILQSHVGQSYPEFVRTLGAGLEGRVPSHSKPTGGKKTIQDLKKKFDSLFEGNPWYREFVSFMLRLKLDPFELHAVNLGISSSTGNLVVLDLGPSFGKI